MRKPSLILLFCVLCILFLGSTGMMLYRSWEYETGQESHSAALQTALTQQPSLPSPDTESSAPALSPTSSQTTPVLSPEEGLELLWDLNLSALGEVNEDVLGWILIPDTPISYPVVQGEDNDYYLNHTWDNRRSSVGAIFLECRSSPDLSDFNTIIYGHRMGNGTMFHSLHEYKTQSYWQEHPYIYLADGSGVWRYDIFASYEVAVDQSTYRLVFPDEEIKETFVQECTARSVLDTGIVPTIQDKVLTLSTCTGRGHETRWVVQGVLAGKVTPG